MYFFGLRHQIAGDQATKDMVFSFGYSQTCHCSLASLPEGSLGGREGKRDEDQLVLWHLWSSCGEPVVGSSDNLIPH